MLRIWAAYLKAYKSYYSYKEIYPIVIEGKHILKINAVIFETQLLKYLRARLEFASTALKKEKAAFSGSPFF